MVLSQTKREIVRDRFRFLLYEISVCFLLIFCVSILEWVILPISLNPELFGTLFYAIRSIIVFLAIPTTIYLMDKYVGPYKGKLRKKTKMSAFQGHMRLYKLSKTNFQFQLLYGILLLFLVFIPLNFVLYLLVPEMLQYHYYSTGSNVLNSYLLLNDFATFFVILILIQTSIAFTEESLFRGFISKRGSDHFNQISAVLISAYFYGFLSLNFLIKPSHRFYSAWFPLAWFFPLFLIGLILSLVTLRKKWLFPAIFSHTISNIIMVSIIWCFSNGWEYIEIILVIYVPLIGIGLILFIFQYDRIKESISIGLLMLNQYTKKTNQEEGEKKGHKYLQIFIDFVIGFLLYLLGFLIAIN